MLLKTNLTVWACLLGNWGGGGRLGRQPAWGRVSQRTTTVSYAADKWGKMLGCLQVKGRSQWGEGLKIREGDNTQSWVQEKEGYKACRKKDWDIMSWFPDRFGEGSSVVERAPVLVLIKSEGRKGSFGILGGGGCYTQRGREWGSKPPVWCLPLFSFHIHDQQAQLGAGPLPFVPWRVGLCWGDWVVFTGKALW